MSDARLLLEVEARKKSGWIAALLNLLLPGAGYAYCGRWILGIIAFLFVVVLFVVSLGYAAGAIVLFLVIDGFLCANRYNKQVIRQVLAEDSPTSGNVPCPKCGGMNLPVDTVCRYCSSPLPMNLASPKEEPTGSPGVADQLERLAALKQQGVLSEAEFQSAKARLLT